ncbi:outer membrane protein G [Vibrio crassostreae]|nr:outer membrane protein G [Vibrio crassostreae]
MKKTDLTAVTLGLLSAFATTAQAEVKDEWNIASNIYVELEKFEGHKNADGDAIIDKFTPVAQLFISNPTSDWSYFLEHKVSRRWITHDFQNTEDSRQRNRTQIGATRKIIKDEDVKFNLNFTYRKESNDQATSNSAGPSHNLYWVMPSGSFKINDKLSFNYWDAFYYYDRYVGANDYEWEAEHGFSYKVNDSFTAKIMMYNDWTWNSDFDETWEQNQIRGYFPTKVNETWSFMPYFRYFLSEKNYDSEGKVTQENDNGLRLGLNTYYKLSEKSTLWMGMAAEKTEWDQPTGVTSGSNNERVFYLAQVGWKHKW